MNGIFLACILVAMFLCLGGVGLVRTVWRDWRDTCALFQRTMEERNNEDA